MGLFSKLFKKDENKAVTATTTENIVEISQNDVLGNVTSTKIDMSKSAENLNKVLIDMSKTSKIDMTKHTARVALAMDYSGSMHCLFDDGSVQDVITRLLPIALKFDDNGELESWLFSNEFDRLNPVNKNNYKNYVKKVMKKSKMYMGGTSYAPVLKDMIHYYRDLEPNDIPVFIIFITDGENWDCNETDDIVRELSNYNMFVQFVGIGNENFKYLRKLDDLSGRKCDNTGFIKVSSIAKMDDAKLYTELLKQYKDWLNGRQ